MAASLSFKQLDKQTDAASLNEVKFITLEDSTGNKYTLDITTAELKLGYHKQGSPQPTEYTVNGLATALGKLLTIDGSIAGKSVLAEEVVKQPVVNAITASADFTNNVYTKTAAETAFVKADGTNATDAGVTAMLDKLTNKVVKADGTNATEAGVKAMLDKLSANEKVAKVSDLTTKVNVTGDNATDAGVTAMLGKLAPANQVAKIDGSNATDPGVTAMLSKLIDANKVLKVDGSNATDAGVNAMLSKLTPANQVVKVDGSNATDPGVTAMLSKLIDANKVLKVDGSNATDAGVTTMLGKLNDKVVQTSELSTKAAGKAVVEAIFDAKDGSDKISETKIANTFAKKDGTNIDKVFAGKLFDAKDGNKLVLVEKLGTSLDTADAVYGAKSDQTAQVFLGGKGLKGDKGEDGTSPSVDEVTTNLINNSDFTNAVAINAAINDANFPGAVREVMSQSYFEPPTSDAAALNWIW